MNGHRINLLDTKHWTHKNERNWTQENEWIKLVVQIDFWSEILAKHAVWFDPCGRKSPSLSDTRLPRVFTTLAFPGPTQVEGSGLQGYLAHKKTPPP